MLYFIKEDYTFASLYRRDGLVVQLVRMPACHAGGREFESRPDRLEALECKFKGFFCADHDGYRDFNKVSSRKQFILY